MTVKTILLGIFTLVVLIAVEAAAQSTQPVTTPWSRYFMRSPDGDTASARLGLGPTNGINAAQATNIVLQAITNAASTLIVSNAAHAGIADVALITNVPPWTGSNYVFLSPAGSPTADGRTRNTPVSDGFTACLIASNLYAGGITNVVIDQMPGVLNEGASGVRLPDNVNWYSEPASVFWWTNNEVNSIGYAGFTVGNNSQVWFLNFYNPDPGASTVCIGEGSVDSITPGVAGKTNWVFYDLNLVTYGTGLHWEGTPDSAPKVGTFVNPVVKANRCCLVAEMPNLHLTLINPTFTTLNFTNNIIPPNDKPFAVIEFNHYANVSNGPAITVQGGVFNYSDTDLSPSNRPCYALWSGPQENGSGLFGGNLGISLSGTLFNPVSITNPASYDIFGSTNGTYLLANVMRSDGNFPTVTNWNSANDCLVRGMATTPLGTPSSGTVTMSTGTTRVWTNAPPLNLGNSFNLPSSAVVGGAGTSGASPGIVGEIMSVGTGIAAATNLTSGSIANITNITITAGVWKIWGTVVFSETNATVSQRVACVAPNTGLFLGGAGGSMVYNAAFNSLPTTTATETNTLICPTWIYTNINIPAAFYLNARATFSAGSVGACGSITAERIY